MPDLIEKLKQENGLIDAIRSIPASQDEVQTQERQQTFQDLSVGSPDMSEFAKQAIIDMARPIIEQEVQSRFETLKGEKGPRGDTVQGPKGERGPQGPEGKAAPVTEISAILIRDKLQSLRGLERLNAWAIQNLPESRYGSMRGGGGSSVVFEVPTGAVNGSNTQFTTSFPPRNATSLHFYVGGKLESFSLSGRTITADTAPPSGADIRVMYAK